LSDLEANRRLITKLDKTYKKVVFH
jgi:hypothetical protein